MAFDRVDKSSHARSDTWEFTVEDNVIVLELREDVPLDEEEFNEIVKEQWAELVTRPTATSHVSHLQMDYVNDVVLEKAAEGVHLGAEHGIDQWAIVSDDIKNLAVKSVTDIPGVEVFTTGDMDKAMEWARD